MFAAILSVIVVLMLGFSLSTNLLHTAEHQKAARVYQRAQDAKAPLLRQMLALTYVDNAGVPVPPSPGAGERLPASVPLPAHKDAWGHALRYCGYNYSSEPLPVGQSARTGLVAKTGYAGSTVAVVLSSGPNGKADTPCAEALAMTDSRSALAGDDSLYVAIKADSFAGHGEGQGGNPFFKDPVHGAAERGLSQGTRDGEVRYSVAEQASYRWSVAGGTWLPVSVLASSALNAGCPAGWATVPATALPNGMRVAPFCVSSGEVQTRLFGSNGTALSDKPFPFARGADAVSSARYTPTPVTFSRAKAQCEWFGGGLINSRQWDALAWRVEQDPRNWTGGAVGNGELIRGVTANGDAEATPVAYGYSQPAVDLGACALGSSRVPGANERTACVADQPLYDLAGNLPEWVDLTAPRSSLPLPSSSFCLVDDLAGCASTHRGVSAQVDLTGVFNTAGLWGAASGTGYYAVTGTDSVLAAVRGGGTQVGTSDSPATNTADNRPLGVNALEFVNLTARAGVRCTLALPE